jgi:glycosyltransferase involved in cell wall biosynthesis
LAPEFSEHLVSVIVPVFNREELVQRALDSVAAQTYRPVELIVVDDGSCDQTPRITAEWMNANERADFRCRLLRQANAGPAAARNAGVQISHGEYIQYLDSDDIMHPQKLELHVSLLRENPSFDYTWSPNGTFSDGSVCTMTNNHNLDAVRREAAKTLSTDVLSTIYSLLGGLYRRRLLLLAGPLNESLTVAEDIEFIARMTALHPNVIYTAVPMIGEGNDAATRTDRFFSTPEGVVAGLNAVKLCERVVDAVSSSVDSRARRALAMIYFWIMLGAVATKNSHAVTAALVGQRRNRRDLGFLTRLAVFELFWRVGASTVALYLARTYSRWRFSASTGVDGAGARASRTT